MTITPDPKGLVVGLWQPDGPLLDVPTAIAALDAAAGDAAHHGARLLVCPELTLTGYDIAEVAEKVAEPAGGPMAAAVADVARRHRLAIAWSWPERDGESVFISTEIVDHDGSALACHRKTHLYGANEGGVYSRGTGTPAVAELDGLRVGLLVCYDIEFPEQVRLLALAGVDLIACPTALMAPYDAVSTLLVRARAYENQVAIAYANRSGTENDLVYVGLSCLVGPDGEDLVRAGDDPGVFLGTLTPARLASARAANTHLTDRRPGLYSALAQPIVQPSDNARSTR